MNPVDKAIAFLVIVPVVGFSVYVLVVTFPFRAQQSQERGLTDPRERQVDHLRMQYVDEYIPSDTVAARVARLESEVERVLTKAPPPPPPRIGKPQRY